MAINDPREDTRPPTFARGHYFETVPHSRIIVKSVTASQTLSMFDDGMLVAFTIEGINMAGVRFAVWEGLFDVAAVQWRIQYAWEESEPTIGRSNIFCRAGPEGEPAVLVWQEPNNFTAHSRDKTLPLVLNESGEVMQQPLTKSDVPEWADPTEIFPDLFLTEEIPV